MVTYMINQDLNLYQILNHLGFIIWVVFVLVGFRKDKLVSEGFNQNKTARQIMIERGYYRIYDCGTKKYEFKISK